MADYPTLNYIPIGMLLAVGDPWQADETLQSGDPGEITQLATAFRDAGECTTETFNEFAQARERFHASWNHEGGAHPIDDSAAVQRATTRLFVQKDQLPLIAIDLQNIAADLAEAEKQSASKIDDLNGKLQLLDMWVGDAIADDRDYSRHLDDAEELTRLALNDIERARDQYTDKLEQAAFDLRLKHGYDPAAIEDVDGDGEASPEERGRTAPEHYDANQRAKDEALVNRGGPMTPEKTSAAARLRDFAIATAPTDDQNVAAEARALAAQRLDDFRMANFVGPLPRDPLIGGDARTRAQARLDMQRQLEQGHLGFPPMTADLATQQLNDSEVLGRVTITKQAYFALTSAGISGDGALKVLTDVADGAGPWLAGTEAYAKAIPQGRHGLPVDLLSASDARVLENIVGRAGNVGDLFQLGVAAYEWTQGGEKRNEELGTAAGSVLGGMGLGWGVAIGAGSVTGPWTTAILVGLAAYAGGELGGDIGGGIGSTFDTPRAVGR